MNVVFFVNLYKYFAMETMVSQPVKLSVDAIAELKRLMGEASHDAGQYLRIGVKGGGCSGLSYVLGFDQQLLRLRKLVCCLKVVCR